MKKLTWLLLVMSMLVMCLPATNVFAVSEDTLQYLLVDALSWGTKTQEFNTNVLKNCSATADLGALATTAHEMVQANSTSAKVKAYTKDDIESALADFRDASTSTLSSLGQTVQQIYTEREFEATTVAGQKGVGGYTGDGLMTVIPNTGAITGYAALGEIRTDINTAITGEAENNNGMRFLLLYLREEAYINNKAGLAYANTHVSSFDAASGTFDFYLNSALTDAAKKQVVGTTNDLISMLPVLSSTIGASTEDTTTQGVTLLGGATGGSAGGGGSTGGSSATTGNLAGKFMTYTEGILNAKAYSEKASFYLFLTEYNRKNEGVIIVSTGTVKEPSPSVTPGAVTSGTSLTLSNADGDRIFYTLDGSVPIINADGTLGANTKEFKATEPIKLTADTTVKYVAVKFDNTNKPTVISPLTVSNYTIGTSVGGGGGGSSQYAVTYANTLGGSISGSTTETVRYKASPKNIPTPTAATGYTFKGWSTDGGKTFVDPTTVVITKRTTFTAVFEATGTTEPTQPDTPFADGHFAYMKGYTDGTFRPNANMTRAEAVVMFSRLLADKMDVNEAYSASFTDVKADDWFAASISHLVRLGVVSGYPDNTFKPNSNITRAEFATIASRFSKLTSGEATTFTDVDASHWAYDYIEFAVSKGWVKGYEDNTFKPNNNITRGEVITVTNRMLGREATDEHVAEIANPINFTDVSSTDWFSNDVDECANDHEVAKEIETVTDETATDETVTDETVTDETAADETVDEIVDEPITDEN